MYLHNEIIECTGRSDRLEIFPFYDMHIGKRNCAEDAIGKQIGEILKRSQMKNRYVRALLGGDQINAINPADVRRFDFHELADWFVQGDAESVREQLGDMANQEINRVVDIFNPIKNFTIGALSGNHEKQLRTHQNVNVHQALCDRLGIVNFTDEAIIRFKFQLGKGRASHTRVVNLYMRHGYGAGRTAGAEPNKLQRMLDEWEDADVCLTGHTHTFCLLPPKPVLRIPSRGKMPEHLFPQYRFAANCGCWLLSHSSGKGTYESSACYPAKPMVTLKIVIWPFWHTERGGREVARPKIELRQYPIL